MAWTTGTVSYFADQGGGVLGLLGKLLEWCASVGYEETIGTGNGVLTTFNFTLTNTPIPRGQCRIRYKIAGVDYETWEDGEGAFSGEKISTATLDRSTGIGSIIFTEPLDNAYVMKAKYTTATEEQDWLILHQRTTRKADGTEAFPGILLQEVILKNAGVSFKDFVGIGMREWQYPSSQRWGWNLNLYKSKNVVDEAANSWNFNSAWSGKSTYDLTNNNYSNHPSIYLKDAEQIKYWFISNKRRIIVIARTASTLYMSAYLGFGKRIATPAQYPQPNLLVGNSYGNKSFSDTTLTYCAKVVDGAFVNKFFSIKPNGQVLVTADTLEGWTWTNDGTVKKTTNNKINLFPLYVINNTQAQPMYEVLYELDGVYLCPNEGIVAEDTITIGADTYLIVPDIYRTNFDNYMAIKLE